MTTEQAVLGMDAAGWESLATAHGTPFYLFDADRVRERISQVRQAMDAEVKVYYAVKANPNLGLLRAVRGAADGVDISSGGELRQAVLAGFDPADMSFAGPAKTEGELLAAIQAGVGCISAESVHEIQTCARLARRVGRPARLLVRVNPHLRHSAFGLKMGGRPVQFGIDEEDLASAYAAVAAAGSDLQWLGMHAYVGSQCFDVSGVVDATQDALRLAAQAAQSLGVPLAKINLGGGFGVAHSEATREIDLPALGMALAPVLKAFKAETAPGCELIFELGRFLTADAGVYVTRVVNTKASRGKNFVVCDGGLNHHLTAAGTFGAALRGNFPTRNLTHPEAPAITCSIAGPSCNPTDLLGVDCSLPKPEAGDLLAVLKSGSYGLTASPMLFLGRPTPAELVRDGAQITVGRRSFDAVELNH